jgi:competence protein ComEA
MKPIWFMIASLTAAQAVAGPPLEGQVNINTAKMDDLVKLPGIGPKKAAAIVRLRERKAFTRPVQIRRIKGIGLRTYKKLLPHLAVVGETNLAAQDCRR